MDRPAEGHVEDTDLEGHVETLEHLSSFVLVKEKNIMEHQEVNGRIVVKTIDDIKTSLTLA